MILDGNEEEEGSFQHLAADEVRHSQIAEDAEENCNGHTLEGRPHPQNNAWKLNLSRLKDGEPTCR